MYHNFSNLYIHNSSKSVRHSVELILSDKEDQYASQKTPERVRNSCVLYSWAFYIESHLHVQLIVAVETAMCNFSHLFKTKKSMETFEEDLAKLFLYDQIRKHLFDVLQTVQNFTNLRKSSAEHFTETSRKISRILRNCFADAFPMSFKRLFVWNILFRVLYGKCKGRQ